MIRNIEYIFEFSISYIGKRSKISTSDYRLFQKATKPAASGEFSMKRMSKVDIIIGEKSSRWYSGLLIDEKLIGGEGNDTAFTARGMNEYNPQ